jgi:hypothetical protein
LADRRKDKQFEKVCSLAKMRVRVAYRCVVALLPDVDDRKRVAIAQRILTLCDGKDRSVRITPAQARDLVLPQLQCVAKQCPLLIFDEPLSRSLNLFFNQEE